MFPKLRDELLVELEGIRPFRSWRRLENQGPERLCWYLGLIVDHGVDRGALVRCLCGWARLALPAVGRHEHRPRRVIELVEACIRAKNKKRLRAEESRLRRAIQDMRRLIRTSDPHDLQVRPGESWAAQAALYTALARESPENALQVPPLVLATVIGNPQFPLNAEGRALFEAMARGLFGWRWPTLTRLPAEPCAPELLVAWDWLSDRVEARPTLSTAELLESIVCRRSLLFQLPELPRSETEQRLLYALADRIALGEQRESLIEGVVHLLCSVG